MKKFEKELKRHKWYICLALFHWLCTFYTDRFIFTVTSEKIVFYMLIKVCFFICLFFFWEKVLAIITGCMKKNNVVIHRLIYSCSYAAILLLMLFIIWPGIWRTDEFGVLGNVIMLQIYWWQHFLTSIFYILSMMLIPIPTGVIIVQVILVSMGFGYIAEKLEYNTQIKWGGFILFLPFCIPSVIMFQLYPMRITLYTIVELVLLFFLYDHIKRNIMISDRQVIMLALGTTILANWRLEGIYYVILLPLFVSSILYRKFINRNQLISYLFIVLVSTISVYAIQSHGIHRERNNAYEITAYAQALPCLVQAAYENDDEKGMQIAEKVIDVEAVMQAEREGKEGIDSFWEGDMSSKEYTSEEFREFRAQYYKWAVRYYQIFLKERTHNFFTSYEQTKSTANLYDDSNIQFVFFLQTFKHVEPIFPVLREKIILFMEKRCWCFFEIPIVMLVFAAFSVFYKNKKLGILPFFILIRIPLVYLTAPDNLFMYYYSFYLSGYVIACFALGHMFHVCHLKNDRRKIIKKKF